jgi:glycolate oxidase iron-sulfur subunit
MTSTKKALLSLDPDELVACVACGLCLPHCPTYRVTGLELASPRGRIAAMRAVQLDGAPLDDAFEAAMEECVQCRGCEAACPSSVPFGRLMEGARETLDRRRPSSRSWRRRVAEWFGYRLLLPRRRLLLATTWVLLIAQRLRLVPTRFGLPRLSARSLRRSLRGAAPTDADVWLFPGCVMDAWQRDVHRSALHVMHATGASVAVPDARAACCGALHVHAGRTEEVRRLARRVIDSIPGDAPVVVDSAGCGAAMKDYGRLLGTPESARFAARVRDFSEWVVATGAPAMAPVGTTVVVQDPCHLRHVQRGSDDVRALLRDTYDLAETADDGLCCGAGGAYAVLQPALSGEIRDRKVEALQAARGDSPLLVVSANPGCAMHLAAVGVDVRHPAQLVEAALTTTRTPTGEQRPMNEAPDG